MECIIDYTDPNIVYASSQYGQIIKSIDGGSNFTQNIAGSNGSGIDANGNWVTTYIMHPTDHNTLLVGKKQIFRNTDGGLNWNQVGSINLTGFFDNPANALAYAPSDPNYIYALFSNSFLCSTDGNTFTDRSIYQQVGINQINKLAVSNTNPNKIWITMSGYIGGEKVYMSNDAGITWTNYSDGLPNLPANCIVYENGSNDRVYVGMDVGVYYRDNSMSSWQPYFDGLPNVIVNEMEIQYSTRKLRAATYGRGLWESDLIPNCTASLNTWTGSVNNAWENPSNWSCGVIPGPNTDVVINSGTIVLSSNVSVRSFTVNPAVNFTVTPGYNFTINH